MVDGGDRGRRPRWVAGLVAAGLALATAVGCGSASPAPADGDAARAQLTRLYETIWGSPAERLDADRLIYVRYQGPIRQCMAAARYGYVPPPFVSSFSRPSRATRAFVDDDVLAPVDAPTVERDRFFLAVDNAGAAEEQVRAAEAPNPAYTKLDARGRRAYAKAGLACQPAQDTYTDLGTPTGSEDLRADLFAVLERAKSAPEVRSALQDYPQCLKDRGFIAAKRSTLVAQAQELFLDPDTGGPGRPGTARWAAAVEFERNAAAADARCRARGHDAALAALGGPLDDFARGHAAALSAARAYWRGLSAEMARSRVRFDRLTAGT